MKSLKVHGNVIFLILSNIYLQCADTPEFKSVDVDTVESIVQLFSCGKHFKRMRINDMSKLLMFLSRVESANFNY